MGCCFSRQDVMERFQDLEERIYRANGIPVEATKKFYVNIKMSDGTAHQIWTVVIDT